MPKCFLRAWRACACIAPLLAISSTLAAELSTSSGNRLTYLDSDDPFYVGTDFPKLTTPQWIGEAGVEAAIVLAIDDMTESAKYEAFLRPILERLKQIEGRAPVSIMTRSVQLQDQQVARWLAEGLTLEVHTVKHPCPLLANSNFDAAAATYYDCIDLLNQVPGNKPVAFRMPCCDSMNSASPRFYAEIFNVPSPRGNFLLIDSSVMNLFTTDDLSLPPELILDAEGSERCRRFFPTTTNAVTKVSMASFATTIENYPYPYVIGRLCWEFPCAFPSDWEAQNTWGVTNAATVADWKATLDATVLKQGVFTMVFHPHGWIRNDQIIELIDYASSKYGKRVKFLTFRDALERLNRNLLVGQSLRATDGRDNGVRLIDLNKDGYMDVLIGNDAVKMTRIWDAARNQWSDTTFPTQLASALSTNTSPDLGVRFAILKADGPVTAFFRNPDAKGAWDFTGGVWQDVPGFFSGLNLKGLPVLTTEHGRDRGVRCRDLDRDGACELIVGNESQNAIFAWSGPEQGWKKLAYGLPEGASFVNAAGQDNGLRLVDVNGDGYDDAIVSNEGGYSLHLFIAKAVPHLGWEVGWSYKMRQGKRGQPREIPMFVRAGPHRNNGAWFHSGTLWVQNEDTSGLPDKVARLNFKELQVGDEPPPRSISEGLASFQVPPGFKIELVAGEPLVVDPVAFDWGPDGKLWVVEMRDYPLGMDGKGKPGGVVKFLESTRGDGHYDKATVFLEGLNFPDGVMPWRKGVLITAAPDIIYAEDTNGDGKADVQKVLFTGFRQGNQQHRINGFDYGLDNWIYCANGQSGGTIRSIATGEQLDLRGHDLRIRPEDGRMELQPGATQFGRHKDDWGNWFGNDNSHWAWHYFLPEHYLARNPFLAAGRTSRQLADYPSANRIFGISKVQQRYNWPDAVLEITSACSVAPYRDVLFGPEFENSLFMCDPANNVVHREVLEQDGVSFTSHRASGEADREFLPSTDNWCRPVTVKTGPDGALYVADMYRLVIEHPEYFPVELRQRPDMRAGEDKGRIYRVYPEGKQLRTIPRLDKLATHELAQALDNPNGWHRDTVQRLIVQDHQVAASKDLERLAEKSANPKVRLQALGTLDGLGTLTPRILERALKDPNFAVRRYAVQISERRLGESTKLASRLFEMADDPDVRVRYQLAFSLGEYRDARSGPALAKIALKDWGDPAMQTAVLSSATGHVGEVLSRALPRAGQPQPRPSLIEKFVGLAASLSQEAVLAAALTEISKPDAGHYAEWQVAGVAGLLDALQPRNISLAEYQKRAGGALSDAISQLSGVFYQAGRVATDSNAPEPERLLAMRLLRRGISRPDDDTKLLGELLGPQNSPEIQRAALSGLRRGDSAGVAEVLLAHWRAASRNQRQEILNALFSRREWTEAVLSALEQGRLSAAELGTVQQQKLLAAAPAIRDRASRIIEAIAADRQQIVRNYRSVGDLTGNREKGHLLFNQNCSICHQLKDEGQRIGPDLGTVADKPVSELVVAILDPNQAVDPAYTGYTAVTADGRELSGILISETPNSITLRMAGGTEEQIARSSLKDFTSSGRSLMPEGFETAFKPQDLADLIAYVLRP